MPRLPIPNDGPTFSDETRAAVRYILETRKSTPPPSTYLTYAGKAGMLLSDLVEHLPHRAAFEAISRNILRAQHILNLARRFGWTLHR